MIDKLVKILKTMNVKTYKIHRLEKESCELFFIKDKLETNRAKKTFNNQVVIYKDFDNFRGQATISISDSDSTEEIETKIKEAEYSAGFVKNEYYDLYDKQMEIKEVKSNIKDLKKTAVIASEAMFKGLEGHVAKLNANEVFVYSTTHELINSKGVHYRYNEKSIDIEIIPTLDDVEIYQNLKYTELNPNKITKDVSEALALVEYRKKAVKDTSLFDENTKVVLTNGEILQVFDAYVYDLTYSKLRSKTNLLNLGDKLNFNENIDITLKDYLQDSPASSPIDNDLVKLSSLELIKDNKIVNNFGNLQYASYLKKPITGMYRNILVEGGKLSKDKILTDNTLLCLKFSGLQVDYQSDYLGGEVRLALLYKDNKITPVTAFSISAKLSEATSTMELSKDIININRYTGPKYLKIAKVKIL